MPGKRKRSTKYAKKRSYKRRKRSTKRKYSMPNGVLAKTFKQAFRYVDTVTLNPTASGNVVYHTFSANGIYDPDVTGTGHQPLAFDQLLGITHNRYTIIGSKIKCTFVSQSSGGAVGAAHVGIFKSTSATPVSSVINTIMESKATKVHSMTCSSAMQNKIVRASMGLSKFFGKKVMQEEELSGLYNSNPDTQAYFIIFACTNNVGLTDPDPIQILVEIDYVGILHDRLQLQGS